MSSIWTALVPALAALAGVALAQGQQGRREARQYRIEQLRELRETIKNFRTALADHRRTMVAREDYRIVYYPGDSGRREERLQILADQVHETRSALEPALVDVQLLAPALSELALAAAHATYALRELSTWQELQDRRSTALQTAEKFTTAASELYTEQRKKVNRAQRAIFSR